MTYITSQLGEFSCKEDEGNLKEREYFIKMHSENVFQFISETPLRYSGFQHFLFLVPLHQWSICMNILINQEKYCVSPSRYKLLEHARIMCKSIFCAFRWKYDVEICLNGVSVYLAALHN